MAAGFVDFAITWRADVFSGAPQSSSAANFGTLGITFRARKAANDEEWAKALATLSCEIPTQPAALLSPDAFYDAGGQVRPDATVELWHADHHGHYDIEGYHFRSMLPIDAKGAYRVETVMPGHYPDRVAQHVHYMVKAPGCKPLVTQLYFATDPVFKGDPDHNFTADPLVHTRELVRPVLLTGDPGTPTAAVTFELVLERA